MISQQTIDKVLESVSIVDVVSEFVTLKKAGVNYKGCCPFHNEKTPSFIVSPVKGICHCFGCNWTGNAVSFLMDHENMSYPEVIRWLCNKYNIAVEELDDKASAEEEKKRNERESLMVCMKAATKFYREQLYMDNADAKAALQYARNRWDCRRRSKDGEKQPMEDQDKDAVSMYSIGWAPAGNALCAFIKQKGYSFGLFEELGMVKKNDDGTYRDFFKKRVMIPVTNKRGETISFTARTLDKTGEIAKYLNTKNSPLFDKSKNVFGVATARRKAIGQNKVYCVEGAPDALKLQAVGVENTVAALGTAWTKEHFEQLRAMFGRGNTDAAICWIPDSDQKSKGKLGPGFAAVLKNGKLSMEAGFRTTVKEIPQDKEGKKQDADSFVDCPERLDGLEEVDFPIWYASKTIDRSAPVSEMFETIKQVCQLIILIKDEAVQMAILKKLSDKYGSASTWNSARKEALKQKQEEEINAQHSETDKDMLRRFGFWPKDNCYFGAHGSQWSNFIMRPLFHVRDPFNSRRMYVLKNIFQQECVVEMRENDMNSLQAFKEKIGSMGNYRWKAGPNELNSLGDFLYETTTTANEVKQLGWNSKGFWSWGNGVMFEGQWMHVDDYGIVSLDFKKDDGTIDYTENFYLPAESKLYRHMDDAYTFERKFIFDPSKCASIEMTPLLERMKDVFGTNAQIGFCFVLASLFKDVITSYTKNFPLLNLFGQKGSGKTEFGCMMMSFFFSNPKETNIKNSTPSGLAKLIGKCKNAMVHIDEYKNSIDPIFIEVLKSAYDGVGRTRMNMDDNNKSVEQTAVDSSVILSGQEMPTIDIALMSRVIYLTFESTTHSSEQRRKFNELAEIRKLGVQHLTNKIIGCRSTFVTKFYDEYVWVLSDIEHVLEERGVQAEDRIWRNWSVLLATYKTLQMRLELPWKYDEIKSLVVEGIIRQCAEVSNSSEMGDFWTVFGFMVSRGFIFESFDYKLSMVKKLTAKKGTATVSQDYSANPRRILMIRASKVIYPFMEQAKKLGIKTMPESSIRYYLQTTTGYLGRKTGSVRFIKGANGVPDYAERKIGEDCKNKLYESDNPWCYDYEMLKEMYDINLDSSSQIPEDKEDE